MTILSPVEYEVVLLSVKVATWSVLISLPLSLATAWLLSRRQFYGHLILDGLVHLPMVIPPVVVGYVLLLLFGRQGPIGGFLSEVLGITIAFTWKGAAIASAVMAFPLMVRAIRLSFQAIDEGLEEAAATLGASPFRVFFTITIPIISPGLIAAAILGFARSLGEFGATITFVSNIPGETRTLPLALFTLIQTPGGDAAAVRLLCISVILALGALIASEYLARRITRQVKR